MRFARRTFRFRHPEVKAAKTIRAWTKEGASLKMKRFLIAMMYGDWAFTYDPARVGKIMDELVCEEIKGEGK